MKYALVIYLFFFNYLYAQDLVFTTECKMAYKEIYAFKFENAISILENSKQKDSKNYFPYFLENYIDFFKLYVSEDKTMYATVEKNVGNRISKLKISTKNSPYYLYTQAEVHLQWALCKLKFKEYLSAIFEIKKAYNLLNENQKKYPYFKPNLKSLGFLHALFGAVPDNYKFGAKILGLRGSIQQGLSEIKSVIDDEKFEFREEAIILYTFIQLHLNKNQTSAWNTISSFPINEKNNILFVFVRANVAQHLGKNDEVINIIQNYQPNGSTYPIHFLEYMLGNALLQQLNTQAISYLQKYITLYKGNSYIKECYRKIAWYYLVQNKNDLYFKFMQHCLTKKEAITDEDKSAHKEAERNMLPDKNLIEARLLFDGNYLQKALAKINTVNTKNLKGRNLVEYYYRKARIYDKLKMTKEANEHYMLTINNSANTNYYFAANACLQLALHYEKNLNKTLALQYFKKALELPKDEYENSINAEAKAGLNRL